MDPEEAKALYVQITAYLRDVRAMDPRSDTDLLSEIEAEIEAGKAVPVRLRVPREEIITDPVAGARAASTRGSVEFIERRPFSPQERLDILVESLALAAAGPALMAERIIAVTSEDKTEGHEETAAPEHPIILARDERPGPDRIVHPEALPDETAAARSLLDLLNEVRAALHGSDRRRKSETT